MVIEKEIWHDSLEALENAKKNVPKGYMVLPDDDPTRLSSGFVSFDPNAKSEAEENAEYHKAPMFGSKEKCQTIEHDDFASWEKALNLFKSQDGTVILPADSPKRLALGFVVHPQREVHYVKLNTLTKEDCAK